MTIHCMFSKNKERLRFNLVENKKFKMHVPFELSINGDNDSLN